MSQRMFRKHINTDRVASPPSRPAFSGPSHAPRPADAQEALWNTSSPAASDTQATIDTATRVFMEPSLSHNFGHIRIHDDSASASAPAPIPPAENNPTSSPQNSADVVESAPHGHLLDEHTVDAASPSKLTVSSPGDPHEHEADQVAGQVMRMAVDQVSVAGTAGPLVQRSTSAAQAAPGTSLGPDGNSTDAIEGIRGGGQPLDAATRLFMEPRFGHDFSRIRIHADSSSASAAGALNAAAFTLGSDIAFASDRYQPRSDPGRHLLAHELTHTIQQAGGASGATHVHGAPLSIQRAVETLGGDWDTDKYDLVNDGTSDIGVEINKLRFKANDPTDATKIGLTQMVNSIDKGSVVALNDTVKSRSIPSGGIDAGSHIDRMQTMSNPIYGMADPTDKGKTLGGSTSTGNSEWGEHYKDKDGTAHHKDAALYDRPTLPDHGANASQIFETEALAVEGPQQGTYYGSVRWGWQSDASNKVTKLPLSVQAVGEPTATFKQASGLWNKGKTSTGAETVDLPIASGTSGTILPRNMSDAQIDVRLKELQDEIANPPSGSTTQSAVFEQKQLLSEQHLRKMGDFPVPEKNPDTAVA